MWIILLFIFSNCFISLNKRSHTSHEFPGIITKRFAIITIIFAKFNLVYDFYSSKFYFNCHLTPNLNSHGVISC